MELSHTRPVAGVVFDDPNLVSAVGLVPVVALAQACRLAALADEHLSVPSDKGANAGAKVTSLVAGMVAGADSIDDMALLRHGAMGIIFDHPYAPSTLGSFLRAFTFGHIRQLDAVASRLLTGLAGTSAVLTGINDLVFVDVDDTIIAVHGHSKQGSGYGYSGVRGRNALLATVTTVPPAGGTVVLRADSAFYGHPTVAAATRAGAQVSVTLRWDPKVSKAIAQIPEDAWAPIEYTDALFDETANTWVSRAEVAEIPFTAFSSKKTAQQVPGRLVVRRIPDLNPHEDPAQATLFDTWRFHALFTTSELDTATADKTHRHHAIIEQVHADPKSSALAHLPSSRFAANGAWPVLATIAFNLMGRAGPGAWCRSSTPKPPRRPSAGS